MKGNARMKMLNALVAAAMIVLFAVHGLGNALQLFDVGSVVPSVFAWALLVLAVLHGAFGVMLTVSTFAEQARAGAAYWGLNRRFWAVRISGLAIAVFVVCHVLVFGQFGDGPLRLNYFGPLQLALSLLLVVSLAVHVLANLQPLMIALGVPQPRGRAADFAVVLCVLLLVTGVAFVVYFLRWSVI